MLCVVISGIPITAKEILTTATNEAFGGAEFVEPDAVQLRSRVRLAASNRNDALVVLDGVSTEKCQDCENGLYAQSDRFHEYIDDTDLIEWLNETLDLNMELPQEEVMEVTQAVSSVGSFEQEELIEKLRVQLKDRDSLIESLRAQVLDLKEQIEDESFVQAPVQAQGNTGISAEEYEKVRSSAITLRESVEDLKGKLAESEQASLELRSQIADLESKKNEADAKVDSVQAILTSLSAESERTKMEYNRLLADYKAICSELDDYKVKYSDMSGLLNSRSNELEEIKAQASERTADIEKVKKLEESVQGLKDELSKSTIESSQLNVELQAKVAEVRMLRDELEATKKTQSAEAAAESKALEDANRKVSELSDRAVGMEKELVELREQYGKLQSEHVGLSENHDAQVEKLQSTINELKERLKDEDSQIIELNKALIQARSTADMLEKSTDRDTDIEDMYKEMNDIQLKYETLANGVFGKISSYSNPHSSLMLDLVKSADRYNHIRFVFSGSTESRKGTYRALLEEFRQLPENQRVVIVDAVCETCVDYVFEIRKVVPGLNWFVKGGGIVPYLSETCLPNVAVLSAGLGYLNDSYLLTVDWETRLKELDNSGYNIVVNCGDISSLVGRVLHESFANRSMSMVYTHGNIIGARTLITNLKGLSNAKSSIMCYFDYNNKVEKFFNIVAKDYDCRIISKVGDF